MKFFKKAMIAIGLMVALSGCSANEVESKKEVLTVGTEGVYAPFTFVDENGELTGYDVEVVREVAKRAGIEVEFVITPWDSMFLGLESKKFDMIANQIGKNPDREKKYMFSNDYLISGAQIIVHKDRDDIQSLEDLKGKKVGTGVGSNYNKILTEFDKDKELDLKYYEGNITTTLQDIENGRIDATLNDRLTVGENVKKLGLKVKLVGEPIDQVPSYFVFRKDSEDMKEKVNKGLEEIKADGTLAEISKKWFGDDYTK